MLPCLMQGRTEHNLKITINRKKLTRVIIDQHYTENHPEINDELIIELVKKIDKRTFEIESEVNGFQYFKVEPVIHEERPYRLVLLLCICDDYLGVVNAFRVNQRNKI